MTPDLSSAQKPQASGTAGRKHRLEFIEGMRAIAALYVVFGHIGAMVDPSGLEGRHSHEPIWIQRLLGPLAFGHLAVAAFIVISGFCLRWAAIQRRDPDASNYWEFMKRRAKRIFPPYYACLIFSLAVALFITPIPHRMPFTQYLPVSWGAVISHFLLVHNLNPSWMYKINGVLWSIAIEFQIYFLYPLFARILRSGPSQRQVWAHRFQALLACIIFTVAVIYLIPRGIKLYPWFTAFFVIGMAGADIAMTDIRKWVPVLTALFAVGIIGAVWGSCLHAAEMVTQIAIVLASVSLLVMGTSRIISGRKTWIEKVFAPRWLAFVGNFSFSLYLIHHPILQVVDIVSGSLYLHPARHLAYLLAIGLPLAIFGSYWFARVFEGRYMTKALSDLRAPEQEKAA